MHLPKLINKTVVIVSPKPKGVTDLQQELVRDGASVAVIEQSFGRSADAGAVKRKIDTELARIGSRQADALIVHHPFITSRDEIDGVNALLASYPGIPKAVYDPFENTNARYLAEQFKGNEANLYAGRMEMAPAVAFKVGDAILKAGKPSIAQSF